MNYIKYILIGILSVSTISCSDFLEENPESDVSLEFLYNTPEGLKAGLIGLYSENRAHFHIHPHEGARAVWEHVTTDLVTPHAGYISIVALFNESSHAPNQHGSWLSSFIWKDHYRVIDRANALIQAGEKIEGMNESDRNNVLAEAKYFRAHSLFTLYKLYNNVYVTTEPTTPDNVFDKVSQPSTKEEIIAAVASDLDFAIKHLEWSVVAGRVNQGLARHIRAKLALWEEDWALAAAQADTVINNGTFYLEPDLRKIFGHPSVNEDFGNRNSSEALFVIQNEEGSAGAGPPTFINTNFMPRYDDIPGVKWDAEQGGRGFGFCSPNTYLFSLYDPWDKRLDAYYQRHFYYNDEENIPDSVLTDHGWVYPELGDAAEIVTTGSNQSAYQRRLTPGLLKMIDRNIPGDAAVSRANILRYRLSETYLVAAEAYMRLGDIGTATERINHLRTRAGVEPLFTLNELELMKEQARELAFEGQRFFFLKRIGRLIAQIQKFAGEDSYKSDARSNIKDRHVNLPIPQTELDLLGAGYPQNEGY